MSVSAAELPEMASDAMTDAAAQRIGARMRDGLRRIAYFVVPSAAAFLALGDVVAGAVFETGDFDRGDTMYVWALLAGSSVGLLASTMGRLYSSAFYALHDTRTPLRFAAVRVTVGVVFGAALALYGPSILRIEARWGAAGITIASGLGAWIELTLLRTSLRNRLGVRERMVGLVATLWMCAAAAALAAWGVKLAIPVLHPWITAILVLGTFGIVYLAATAAASVDEARALLRRGAPSRR